MGNPLVFFDVVAESAGGAEALGRIEMEVGMRTPEQLSRGPPSRRRDHPPA